MKKTIIVIALVLLTIAFLQAEQFELNNGQVISGTIISADDLTITIDAGFGTTMTIKRSSIKNIIFKEGSQRQSRSNRSDVQSTDFQERTSSTLQYETISLLRRMAGASGVMGAGIGVSSIGIAFGIAALACVWWFSPVTWIAGTISLVLLAPGLPMWIGGAVARNSAKRQLEMMNRMSLDSGNTSAPVLSSKLLTLPIS